MKKGIALMLAAVLTASTVGSVGGSFDAWAAEDMTAIVTWDFAEGIDGWYAALDCAGTIAVQAKIM